MAGVDPLNQFPNSKMARAVRVGQSRIISPDMPSIPVGESPNQAIAAPTALTVPPNATYGVIQADGGPLYYTMDGSDPSATHYAGMLQSGSAASFYNPGLSQIKVFGTSMSVTFYGV